MQRTRLFTVFFALFAFSAVADDHAPATTLVHAGTLLAVPGEPPTIEQTIVIESGRIARIEEGFTDPQSFDPPATVVDLSDHFVLPGLMDLHVHLTGQLGPNSRNDALYVTTSMSALRGAKHARITLAAGFTTVRDLGGDPEAIYALRDATAKGIVPGPRMLVAGRAIVATGSYGPKGFAPHVRVPLGAVWAAPVSAASSTSSRRCPGSPVASPSTSTSTRSSSGSGSSWRCSPAVPV